jgi:hypothetical protein
MQRCLNELAGDHGLLHGDCNAFPGETIDAGGVSHSQDMRLGDGCFGVVPPHRPTAHAGLGKFNIVVRQSFSQELGEFTTAQYLIRRWVVHESYVDSIVGRREDPEISA